MTMPTPGSTPLPASADPVLFYDGECGLCQRIVRVLLRLDRAGRLRYAPLQGPTAQAYLRTHGLPTEDFDSLVFVPAWHRRDQPEYRLRTDGVIGALHAVGGFARVFTVIAILPRSWRDAGYKAVARLRYRLFGPAGSRPFSDRSRFLP